MILKIKQGLIIKLTLVYVLAFFFFDRMHYGF
jgi:hypothetical protein